MCGRTWAWRGRRWSCSRLKGLFRFAGDAADVGRGEPEGEIEAVFCFDAEAGGLDDLCGVSGGVAAVGEATPEGLPAVLGLGKWAVGRRGNVFQIEKCAAGLEGLVDGLENGGGVVYGTED